MSRAHPDRHLTACALAAACAVLLITAHASAWEPLHPSQPVWCEPAPYALGRVSSDLGNATTTAEVRRGMDAWSQVSCTSLQTQWRGPTAEVAGVTDGVSVVGWDESGWPHDPNAIGVTGPRWGFDGCIREADMEMNGVHYTWSTNPGVGNRVNAYSIITHEGGHYYGLGHSDQFNAIMYFAYTGGEDTITLDDQQGICALYPGGGTVPVDCTTTGCPAGQECMDGECRAVAGDGGICAPCSEDSDCGGPNDYCLVYPDGSAACGRACTGPGQCGSAVCADLGGIGQCVGVDGSGNLGCSGMGEEPGGCRTSSDCDSGEVCDPGTGDCDPAPVAGRGLGQSCEANTDCQSRLCLPTPGGSVCSQSCDGLDTSSCPSGFFCDGNATGVCGTGVCLAGSAGPAALGQSCSVDTDCASLFCDGSVCAMPCIPGGAVSCPHGYQCQAGAAAGCGACKMAGAMGAACEVNEDCVTRFCARREATGVTFCTDLCTSNEDCPAGFTCDPTNESLSVCAPPVDDVPPDPPAGATGAECSTNDECDSGLCAIDGDRQFCTELCTTDQDCPASMQCEGTTGTESVCAPRDETPDPDAEMGGGRGGGCAVTARGNPPWATLMALVAIALWRRRRA